MAKTRLTPLSKLLIVVVIVGGLGYLLLQLRGSDALDNLTDKVNSGNVETKEGYQEVINIGVVTWGGYAGGQYYNKGFEANTESNFYKEYGFQVNFKVIDDFDASRDAFKNGDIDLMWATIDAFPTEVEGLGQYQPQVVFQADWSRGGDAIVAGRGINKVADLKGKRIAVAPMSPSHSFLIWLLEAGDLTTRDVTIVEVPSAIDAADAFKSNNVDAAVVWSPDDADCVAKVPGSKVLESTRNASQIIADVFIGKKEWVENHKDQLRDLYEGWMRGSAELNGSDAAKRDAAKILAAGLAMPEDFCYDAINNVRLTTHGDNQNFFGLNYGYNGVTGEELYNRMKMKYEDLGYGTSTARSWRLIASSGIVSSVNLSGPQHQAETGPQFAEATEDDLNREALSTKRVSISFRTGEYLLDGNAKQIVDLQMVPIAKAFSNARIRIEGNTDNTGSRTTNVRLSRQRAQAVADYLMQQHGMPANRLIVIGNGPDKPVPGCESNGSADCRAQNRRTDFELISE